MSEHEPGRGLYAGQLDDERLRHMANVYGMDRISMENLLALGLRPSDSVLDIGSGPSASLGEAIGRVGATYVAVDTDEHAIASQVAAGHRGIVGPAEALQLPDNAIDVVHARASLSWLGPDGRTRALDEILRVGGPNSRGALIEYDWNAAGGHPELEKLKALFVADFPYIGNGKFDPFLGAHLEEDAAWHFNERLDPAAWNIESSRSPIPAQDINQKLAVIKMLVTVAAGDLLSKNNPEDQARAEALQAQLAQLIASNPASEDIRLPDIVSVRYRLSGSAKTDESAAQKTIEAGSLHTFELANDLRVVRLLPGWDEARHPLGTRARSLFKAIYRARGYIVKANGPEGLSPEDLDEAVDPRDLRAREDMMLTLNAKGTVVSTARYLAPNEDGITSLPTGVKLLDKYGPGIFPEGFLERSAGEIVGAAGRPGHPLSVMGAILLGVRAAREAETKFLLYGAVTEGVKDRLAQMFGPVMVPFKFRGTPATVTVIGRAYRPDGIQLATGYASVETLFTDLIDFYQERDLKTERDRKNAAAIIDLCRRLQQPWV